MRTITRRVIVPGGSVFSKWVGARASLATPLVVLHGGPGCPHDYLEPLERMAGSRPILFYDQLGCGQSDRPNDSSLWTLPRFVDELRSVVDAWGLDSFDILGHSWGTMLAVDYALTEHDRVRRLVLASPCLSMRRVLGDMRRHLKALGCTEWGFGCASGSEAASFEQRRFIDMDFFRRYIYRGDALPECLIRANRSWGHPVYEIMWGAAEYNPSGALSGYEREECLSQINMPVLLLCGEYDEFTPSAMYAYALRFPSAEAYVIERSAHLAHLEQPEKFLERVDSFLSK